MKNLKIYSSKERLPKPGEMFLMFGIYGGCMGNDAQDIKYTSLEYSWEEYDGDFATGVSYSYNKGKKPNNRCKLLLIDNNSSCNIVGDFLYAKSKDVDKLYGGKWKGLK